MTLLVDTSAWLEFALHRESLAFDLVSAAVRDDQAAVTAPVIAEVLAGVRGTSQVSKWRSALDHVAYLPLAERDDWEAAAAAYRACRERGVTPRSLLDCVIAAVALRNDVAVLHCDRDFDQIASCTGLKVLSGL